jgi:hypothetical protein
LSPDPTGRSHSVPAGRPEPLVVPGAGHMGSGRVGEVAVAGPRRAVGRRLLSGDDPAPRTRFRFAIAERQRRTSREALVLPFQSGSLPSFRAPPGDSRTPAKRQCPRASVETAVEAGVSAAWRQWFLRSCRRRAHGSSANAARVAFRRCFCRSPRDRHRRVSDWPHRARAGGRGLRAGGSGPLARARAGQAPAL